MKMVIEKEKHKLPESNYISEVNPKKKIILTHSSNVDMNHFTGWLNRLNGKYTKVAPYTIDYDGTIYEHYDPKFSSNFLGDEILDKSSIPIMLVNRGWLTKDTVNNNYVDWIGNKVKCEVYEKRWRGYSYWEQYTNEQITATIELVEYLCNRFKIENKWMGHNVKTKEARAFEGILCQSNLNMYVTNLSPAFRFDKLNDNEEIIA